MLKRTSQRLRHLNRLAGLRIVRQPVVLTAPVSELGLQKKIGARNHSCPVRSSQTLANSSFEVVPALVGGVDSAKSHAQRKFGQRRSSLLLPRSAVKKIRN